MDTAGIGKAIKAGLDAVRFRLFVKPVEHQAKGEAYPGGKRRRVRTPTGSFVVGFSGGRIAVTVEDGIATSERINAEIRKRLEECFRPKIKAFADFFVKDCQDTNRLVSLGNLWDHYKEAISLRVQYHEEESSGIKIGWVCPSGPFFARFDAALWGERASDVAQQFAEEINKFLSAESGDRLEKIAKDIQQQVSQ